MLVKLFYLFCFALPSLATRDLATEKGGCGFDDNLLLDDKTKSQQKNGGSGGFQIYSKPSTRWKNNKVNYLFDESVQEFEREQIEDAMDVIDDNTCIKFIKVEKIPRGAQYLHISIKNVKRNKTDNACGTSGNTRWYQNDPSMRMTFTHTFKCGSGRIGNFTWLAIHELGHVLGVAHTQRRPDRDEHIKFRPECTQERSWIEFEKFKKTNI